MTATVNSIHGKRAKVEITINAAAVAALASLTTAESIDISGIVKNVSAPTVPERGIAEEYVVGDDNPIEDYDDHIGGYQIEIDFLYTNGKDTLGTDTLDIYHDVLLPFFTYTSSPALSLPLTVSMAGGAVGDMEWTTSAANTRVMSVSPPIGGVDTNGKLRVTAKFYTPTLTHAVIS